MLQPAYYHLKTDNTASFTQAYPTKQSAAFVKRVLVACSCSDNHICPIVLMAALTTISVSRRSLQDALTCWHWPHHLTSCSTKQLDSDYGADCSFLPWVCCFRHLDLDLLLLLPSTYHIFTLHNLLGLSDLMTMAIGQEKLCRSAGSGYV